MIPGARRAAGATPRAERGGIGASAVQPAVIAGEKAEEDEHGDAVGQDADPADPFIPKASTMIVELATVTTAAAALPRKLALKSRRASRRSFMNQAKAVMRVHRTAGWRR